MNHNLTCDKCKQQIVTPESGILQWKLLINSDKAQNVYILHENCMHSTNDPSISLLDETLNNYLGPDGLTKLLSKINDSVFDDCRSDFLEIIMRLQIPNFEEARGFIQEAINDGFVEPNDGNRFLNQKQLMKIISHYKK